MNHIAIVLNDGFDALDAIGPREVFQENEVYAHLRVFTRRRACGERRGWRVRRRRT